LAALVAKTFLVQNQGLVCHLLRLFPDQFGRQQLTCKTRSAPRLAHEVDRSADWQSAVLPVGSRRKVAFITPSIINPRAPQRSHTDCQSALLHEPTVGRGGACLLTILSVSFFSKAAAEHPVELARDAFTRYHYAMNDLVFEVIQEGDGGFCAQCLTDSIVTEGDTWEELRANVLEVVKAFYFDQPGKLPLAIRLHLVRDEVLACA
jgi:hypothetical protein